MRKAHSRCLVIDASIAVGAGGKGAPKPTSKACRDILEAVLRICHTMAWTAAIKKEWDDHEAGFARQWRVQMMGRKKIKIFEGTAVPGLERRALSTAPHPNGKAALKKDLHLVYAALEADQLVLSCDEVVRNLLVAAKPKVAELEGLGWVNPDKDSMDVIKWLENGAPVNAVSLASAR